MNAESLSSEKFIIRTPIPKIFYVGKISPIISLFLKARRERRPLARLLARRMLSNWRLLEQLPQSLQRYLGQPSSLFFHLPSEDKEFFFSAIDGNFRTYYVSPIEGVYEPEVTVILRLLLGDDDTFYDIGSNWGYYSFQTALRPGFRGKIHAFEASPRTCKQFQSIKSQLGVSDDLEFHCFGLSDREGRASMDYSNRSGDNACARLARSGDIDVHLKRLDDLAIDLPDVIKMDVEGHELPVLRGGEATIGRARPFIVLEVWNKMARDRRARYPVLEHLAEDDYRIFRFLWATTRDATPDFDLRANCGDTAYLVLDPVRVSADGCVKLSRDVLAVPNEKLVRLADLT